MLSVHQQHLYFHRSRRCLDDPPQAELLIGVEAPADRVILDPRPSRSTPHHSPLVITQVAPSCLVVCEEEPAYQQAKDYGPKELIQQILPLNGARCISHQNSFGRASGVGEKSAE